MNSLFNDMADHVATYIDDVVIFNRSWEDHLAHIKETLQRIRKAGLTVKAKKCQMAMAECIFLGHTVGRDPTQPRSVTSSTSDNQKPRRMSDRGRVLSPVRRELFIHRDTPVSTQSRITVTFEVMTDNKCLQRLDSVKDMEEPDGPFASSRSTSRCTHYMYSHHRQAYLSKVYGYKVSTS